MEGHRIEIFLIVLWTICAKKIIKQWTAQPFSFAILFDEIRIVVCIYSLIIHQILLFKLSLFFSTIRKPNNVSNRFEKLNYSSCQLCWQNETYKVKAYKSKRPEYPSSWSSKWLQLEIQNNQYFWVERVWYSSDKRNRYWNCLL